MNKSSRAEGMVQVIDYLPSKQEALSSNPTIATSQIKTTYFILSTVLIAPELSYSVFPLTFHKNSIW
jgi:hypothetical protein